MTEKLFLFVPCRRENRKYMTEFVNYTGIYSVILKEQYKIKQEEQYAGI